MLTMKDLLETCFIEAGALERIPDYLESKGYRKIQLVVDERTYAVAGKAIEQLLAKASFDVQLTSILSNEVDDVIADEKSIVQLLLNLQSHQSEIVIAIGGGTIHDISRYAAYTMKLNFISVPTAPSVDGFNSVGAPIIVRGYKKTIPAIGPEAVFADLNVLVQAPQAMIAAGFGDILGKYTSLFDWKFGSLVAGEPYAVQSEQITREALQKCVDHVALIAKRDEQGIALLTRGLMESGVAMLLFGRSHPASGAEHHLSHYWEMEYIKLGRRQLLHGAKVGCACVEISKLYHQLKEEDFALQPKVKEINDNIAANWNEIVQELNKIPSSEQIASLLAEVGGPNHYSQLGVSEELFARSLQEAHLVRPERYTLLHARNIVALG